MSLAYKTRRRLSLLILLIGLPIYIMLAVMLVSVLPRQNTLVELAIYVILGIVWVLPFKKVFLGVGQADPDAGSNEQPDKQPPA